MRLPKQSLDAEVFRWFPGVRVPGWVESAVRSVGDTEGSGSGLRVETALGEVVVKPGDWVMCQLVTGEGREPEIFVRTYTVREGDLR